MGPTITRYPLGELSKFCREHGMRGGWFGILDRTPLILSYYAAAGWGLRLVEMAPEPHTADDSLSPSGATRVESGGHTWTRNSADKVISVLDAHGAGNNYTYDAAGRMLTDVVTGPGGRETGRDTYTYNSAGSRLTHVRSGADGRVQSTTTYTYDSEGRRLTRVDTDADGKVIVW